MFEALFYEKVVSLFDANPERELVGELRGAASPAVFRAAARELEAGESHSLTLFEATEELLWFYSPIGDCYVRKEEGQEGLRIYEESTTA